MGALFAASMLAAGVPTPAPQAALGVRATSDKMPVGTPATAITNAAMLQSKITGGNIQFSYVSRSIWNGKAKAKKGGKARWDFRR